MVGDQGYLACKVSLTPLIEASFIQPDLFHSSEYFL